MRFVLLIVIICAAVYLMMIPACNTPTENMDVHTELYVEMIARATLQAYHEKVGEPGMPMITILEGCEGVTCSPVHRQVDLCRCRSGEQFYHVLVESDPGSFFHVCFDMQGNMGQCPSGTY